MLPHIGKTVGSAMAGLCLVATLAMAQDQPLTPQHGNTTPQQGHRQHPSDGDAMRMLCTKDNGKGDCVAATDTNGKEFVVVGEGLKSGAYMTCMNTGNIVHCQPASEQPLCARL